MLARNYTKADLERIVLLQLENLNAIHDLMKIMKFQNELLANINVKMQQELSDVKKKGVKYSRTKSNNK